MRRRGQRLDMQVFCCRSSLASHFALPGLPRERWYLCVQIGVGAAGGELVSRMIDPDKAHIMGWHPLNPSKSANAIAMSTAAAVGIPEAPAVFLPRPGSPPQGTAQHDTPSRCDWVKLWQHIHARLALPSDPISTSRYSKRQLLSMGVGQAMAAHTRCCPSQTLIKKLQQGQ